MLIVDVQDLLLIMITSFAIIAANDTIVNVEGSPLTSPRMKISSALNVTEAKSKVTNMQQNITARVTTPLSEYPIPFSEENTTSPPNQVLSIKYITLDLNNLDQTN